jgi:hypothetical protein
LSSLIIPHPGPSPVLYRQAQQNMAGYMTDSTQAASLCPLCGGENQCAIAAGKPADSCWCNYATISAEAKAKAADSAGERCICPTCGQPTEGVKREG